MALQARFGNAHDSDDVREVAPLRLGALLRGQVHSGAFVHSRSQVGGRHLRARRQPRPQRILKLVGTGVVTAVILIDRAQVEAEVVGARRARQHSARKQRGVVIAPAVRTRAVEFDYPRAHQTTPRLAVHDRPARLAERLHEILAQILGVFGGHEHTVPTAPVLRRRVGITLLEPDRPARHVLLAALRPEVLAVRATARVHDEYAVPVLGNRDEVMRAVRVLTHVARSTGGHGGRTGSGRRSGVGDGATGGEHQHKQARGHHADWHGGAGRAGETRRQAAKSLHSRFAMPFLQSPWSCGTVQVATAVVALPARSVAVADSV